MGEHCEQGKNCVFRTGVYVRSNFSPAFRLAPRRFAIAIIIWGAVALTVGAGRPASLNAARPFLEGASATHSGGFSTPRTIDRRPYRRSGATAARGAR